MITFIPSKQLGVLEAVCYEPLRNAGIPVYTTRDRARHLKKAIRVLKDLKLLPSAAKVSYFGYVISAAGEGGFLIVYDEPEAVGQSSTSIRGAAAPQEEQQ